MRQEGCMISHAEQDVHEHHNMSWTAPTALYKSVLQVSWSFFMLVLPLHDMSVLAINLLICLYQMTVWLAEVMHFLCFFEFSYQEAACYYNICTVNVSKAFLLSWLMVQKRNPPTIPSLSVIFSSSVKPFIFFFTCYSFCRVSHSPNPQKSLQCCGVV